MMRFVDILKDTYSAVKKKLNLIPYSLTFFCLFMHSSTETCMNAVMLVFVISVCNVPIMHYKGASKTANLAIQWL